VPGAVPDEPAIDEPAIGDASRASPAAGSSADTNSDTDTNSDANSDAARMETPVAPPRPLAGQGAALAERVGRNE